LKKISPLGPALNAEPIPGWTNVPIIHHFIVATICPLVINSIVATLPTAFVQKYDQKM
jgi:hypothetical protein